MPTPFSFQVALSDDYFVKRKLYPNVDIDRWADGQTYVTYMYRSIDTSAYSW